MDSDKINSFDDFLSTLKTKDLCDFYFKVYEDSVLFFLIDANNLPNITCSLKVKFNLEVEVYYKNLKVPSCKFEWILSKHALPEQPGLTIMSKPRYSSNMLLWASTLYFQFPGAYKMLRDTGCLTLPHPIYLSQITADIKTDVGIKQSQIQYLKRKADNLAPHEKFINILFDEIHIAPKVEYRGGVLRGLTEKNEVANKKQAFMLSSVFSKNEDIIALYPVKENSSEMLKKMTLGIIKILTDVGYTIVSLIGDNHRMNRGMIIVGVHDRRDRVLIVANIIWIKTMTLPNPQPSLLLLLHELILITDAARIYQNLPNNFYIPKYAKF
nr:unnamed protein product [Callosobruchus analis]